MSHGSRLHGRNAHGFSLVAAIFILVVLATLAAFMVTIGAVQRWTTVGAAQGARAYQAAHAGIEWGILQAVGTGGSGCAAWPAFTLDGFSVTVNCTQTGPHTEGGVPYLVYSITSTAVSIGATLGNPDYFSRSLQVTVTSAP